MSRPVACGGEGTKSKSPGATSEALTHLFWSFSTLTPVPSPFWKELSLPCCRNIRMSPTGDTRPPSLPESDPLPVAHGVAHLLPLKLPLHGIKSTGLRPLRRSGSTDLSMPLLESSPPSGDGVIAAAFLPENLEGPFRSSVSASQSAISHHKSETNTDRFPFRGHGGVF